MARTTSPHLEALLDEHAAAELLGCSPRTLQDWRWRGEGPEFVRLGRAVRYAPSALRDFITSRTRRSTSDPGRDAA